MTWNIQSKGDASKTSAVQWTNIKGKPLTNYRPRPQGDGVLAVVGLVSINLNLLSCLYEFIGSSSGGHLLDSKTTISYIVNSMAVDISSANPQYYRINQIHHPGQDMIVTYDMF